MGKDIIRELANGPETLNGLCIEKKFYCLNCNGREVSNCPKSPTYKGKLHKPR